MYKLFLNYDQNLKFRQIIHFVQYVKIPLQNLIECNTYINPVIVTLPLYLQIRTNTKLISCKMLNINFTVNDIDLVSLIRIPICYIIIDVLVFAPN